MDGVVDMEAPKCDLCGSRHWSGQPHKFGSDDQVKVKPGNRSSGAAEPVPVEPVMVEDKPSKFGEQRYKDREARKAYQREWKRRKRGKP